MQSDHLLVIASIPNLLFMQSKIACLRMIRLPNLRQRKMLHQIVKRVAFSHPVTNSALRQCTSEVDGLTPISQLSADCCFEQQSWAAPINRGSRHDA